MDRGLSFSAALASSPSSPLSITVHWCPPFPLFSPLTLSPSLVGLGKRAACLHTSGQDWWLVNSISQHCRPHWCRTKSIGPSKKSSRCIQSLLAWAPTKELSGIKGPNCFHHFHLHIWCWICLLLSNTVVCVFCPIFNRFSLSSPLLNKRAWTAYLALVCLQSV